MNCIYCSQPLLTGERICSHCGRLQGSSTGVISAVELHSRDPLGVEVFSPTAQLVIVVRGKQTIYTIPDQITMGRRSENGEAPGIDLTDAGAYANGVSRLHAELRRAGETLFIADLRSKNGTWVNGVQVEPGTPRPVHDGDTIRLGTLSFYVYFK